MSKDSRQSESNDSTYKARALEQAAQPAAESEQIDALALQRAVDGPGFTAPNDILNLQRAAGNRAVSRLIQTKLTVGPAGDKYEQEADAVAEKVLRMPERPPSIDPRPPIDDGIRRSAVDGRRSYGDGSFQPGQVFERSLSSGSSGSPLPGSVRNYMEPRFGADFSNVRVHTDSRAEQLNNRIQAQAFTRGSDVFFGAGKYNPGTTAGNHLLAHELTHVVQQGAAHAPHRRASRFPIARARIQRWGKSEQQKQDELKQNKDELTALKRDIYFKLEDGAWPEAIAGIKKHNIQYSKSGWWGGTRLAKWFRDTLNLNPLRQKAKALIPNKDTKPSDEVLKSVSDIARDTRSAAKSDTLTTGNLSNHPHILGTVKKIGHYLVSSIPTSVMGFVKSFSDTDLDLATELGASVDRGAPRTGAPSTRVNTDVQDLKNSLSTGVIEGRGFHGSASWLLEG
ncbi:MAG: DUF4157 domain-containing protein, partial [Anaerolineales bacterium]